MTVKRKMATRSANAKTKSTLFIKASRSAPKPLSRKKCAKSTTIWKDRLNEQVKLRNADKGDLPEFVIVGSQTVQLGHVALTIHLEQMDPGRAALSLATYLPIAGSDTVNHAPGPADYVAAGVRPGQRRLIQFQCSPPSRKSGLLADILIMF